MLTEELQGYAGVDPAQDRYRVGYISCIRDLLNTDVDTEETQ